MPRVARVVAVGVPHHVTQRGNNRQDVFFTDDDRRFYLHALREQTQRFDVTVTAYCLMTNHVHLVATPRRADALARAIGRTHWLYARYVNHLHGRTGHLWQNRFHSCALDAEYEVAAVRYVERNPVRSRLVRVPWRYKWSSAAAHVGEPDGSGMLTLSAWRRRYAPAQWRTIVCDPLDDELANRLRTAMRRGRPLGSDVFVTKLEALLGRRLRTLPRGRPRKKTKNNKTASRRRK